MVDHCGLPYERDKETMKLWREGKLHPEEEVEEEGGEREGGGGEREGGGGKGSRERSKEGEGDREP